MKNYPLHGINVEATSAANISSSRPIQTIKLSEAGKVRGNFAEVLKTPVHQIE